MSKLNFNIVEGDDFPYDEFAKDYMNTDLSKADLMEKYNLTKGMYYRRMKYARETTGFSRRKSHGSMKYIMPSGRKYCIRRGSLYCGTYDDLKTAKMVRDLLIKTKWDKDVIRNCIKLYANSKGRTNCNRDNHMTKQALKKYNEFKKLFMSGEHSYEEILAKLGFTRHQYNVCHDKLKKTHPGIRKKMVRTV